MGSSNKERRTQMRLGLYGELPARFLFKEDRREVAVSPVDVTSHGLGLLVNPAPEVGQDLVVEFEKDLFPSITLRCCHNQPPGISIPGMENLRRCGFVVVTEDESSLNLIQIFGTFDTIVMGE